MPQSAMADVDLETEPALEPDSESWPEETPASLDQSGRAHLAGLIDDLLSECRATPEDRQAIADHLTGRRRLDQEAAGEHDSWAVASALAQAWNLYSQRVDLPPAALLGVLDGTCSMVTQYVDTETAARILEATQEEATQDQVADLVHWMEREDLWDSALTAQQVRAAWDAYRNRHLQMTA